MTAPSSATARPWCTEIDNIFAGPIDDLIYVADCAPLGGPVDGRPEQIANAALIVEAVNAYDAHQACVEALRECSTELGEYAAITINGYHDQRLAGIVDRARAAVAALEGVK
jgi:hypothetical protein